MKIEIKNNIKFGPYIEIYSSIDNVNINPWNEKSIYIDECAFGIFQREFRESCIDFDEYGVNKFNQNQQKILIDKLRTLRDYINTFDNKDNFVGYLREKTGAIELLEELNFNKNNEKWEQLQKSILEVLNLMIKYVKSSYDDGCNLYVFGV